MPDETKAKATPIVGIVGTTTKDTATKDTTTIGTVNTANVPIVDTPDGPIEDFPWPQGQPNPVGLGANAKNVEAAKLDTLATREELPRTNPGADEGDNEGPTRKDR